MAENVDDVLSSTEAKMKKAIESAGSDLATVRTGRASASLVDRLHVESYGQNVPLKQVAGVTTPDARTITISAWDRSTVAAIRKAIEKSDLGLTPNIDGSTIRLIIPPLNEERRKDLVKVIKKKGEEAKIAIRNVRQKGVEELRALQKSGKITEDDNKRGTDKVQKLTDKSIKEIDSLLDHKEREIMEV